MVPATLLRAEADSSAGGMVTIFWGATDREVNPKNGRLAGILEARDDLVLGYLEALDELALALINEFNAVHQQGYTLADDTTGSVQGGDFFVGSGAADIDLHDDILNDLKNIAASGDGAPGNGENALNLANVYNRPVTALGDVSMRDYFTSLISGIGVSAQQADNMVESQGVLVDHLLNRRDGISGVSLDEEMVDMIRFQQAYAAAARVITAMDEALETIIGRMGIVGR